MGRNRTVVYKYDTNPFYVFLKKHVCPKCKRKLERRLTSKVVNWRSEEVKLSGISFGGTIFPGDVEYRTGYLHCSACNLDISYTQMKAYEWEEQK